MLKGRRLLGLGKKQFDINPGADPGFFLGGGAPVRNGVTDLGHAHAQAPRG